MSTYEVACTHKNIRNTANCPSFVRTRATTATIVLRACKDITGSGVCMRDEWALRSDTILNQHIVPANSWQSCHILLWNSLSILLTRHRRDCEWTIEGYPKIDVQTKKCEGATFGRYAIEKKRDSSRNYNSKSFGY